MSADDRTFLALAGRAAMASGVLAAIGIAFLILMFASFSLGSTSAGQAFGRINDVLVLLSYLLAGPAVVAFHLILRRRKPVLSTILFVVGLGAILAIAVLQASLVVGALTFEEQIGPVSVALLALGAWFVLSGHLATSIGAVPRGVRMGLLAASYVGYPVWAIWIGRIFLDRPPSAHPHPLVATAEE